MKCPKCRKQLRKGAKFCPACGTRVEKKRGIRFTSILLVIVLLLSIVAIGWSGGILFAKHFGGKIRNLFSEKEHVEIHNVEEAIAHAQGLGEELGYENAMSELTEKVTTTVDGENYYRLQQNYQGVPVYGRTVVCATDKDGNVTSITGNVQDVDAEINLTPTITAEQAQQSIQVYRTDVLNLQTSEQPITIELCKENLYVYIDADQPVLVYSFLVGANRMILDAHDARILSWLPVVMPNEIWYTGPEGTKSVLGTNPIEGRYILKDAERNIYVYDAQGKTYWYPGTTQKASSMKIDVPLLVNSTDMEFGNNDDNTDSSGIAYIFLNELGTVYDFFAKMGETGVGTFVGICNDLMNDPDDPTEGYQGKNGGGYCGPLDGMLEEEFPDVSKPLSDINAAVIIIGSAYNRNMSEIYDLFGHEYQHTVFQKYVTGGSNSKEESGAIDEGIADIMGELYEASRGEINWEHGNRIIHDPSQKGYPESVSEIDSKLLKDLSTDFSHGCSTVISHSAYLMWNGIDGNDSQRLSTEELAELWYRAVLMMPSDCDFNECRELVELAATTMTLSTAQRACVAEAFDNVGITGTSQSNDSKVIIFTASGETAVKGTVYEVKTENGIETIVPVSKATMTVYSGNSTKSYEKMNMKNEDGFFEIELPAGTYSVAITADGYIGQTLSFELANNEVRYFSVELTPSDNKTGNKTDAYRAYLNATQKTMASGSWSEHLIMTANMAITDGSAKTKTKVTLTSNADVSNYSESDPSQIRMSGSAEMTVMGQTYAWNMEYENGTAHYRYTKPNQTSADMKIDPSFFNFGTMTSDMMTNAKLSGNKITFTVPGEKIAEVGIAAVNQMSGVDDLEYGDVDVTVTISNDGKIDNIIMAFHASLEYQGYDADVDYDIDYRFTAASAGINNTSTDYSAFVPIVQAAIEKCSYSSLSMEDRQLCRGILTDLNQDGIKELVMKYPSRDFGSMECAVWCVNDGVVSCASEELLFAGGVGYNGSIYQMNVGGRNCLVYHWFNSGNDYGSYITFIYSVEGIKYKQISMPSFEPWTEEKILNIGEALLDDSNKYGVVLPELLSSLGGHTDNVNTCASGSCGADMVWALDNNGTLTISGRGEMTNYYLEGDDDDMRPPWLNEDVKVTNIVFNGNITSIGNNAFCFTSIKDITIPASVSEVYYSALKYIDTLEKIYVESGNTVFACDDSGVLFNKDKTSLITAPAKLSGTYTVPTSVTWINDNAFLGCSGLNTINWPDSVNTIGQGAFSGCTSLEYICIPSSVTLIDHYTFNDCVNLSGIRISENITSVGYLAFGNCNLKDVFYGGTEIQWQQLIENCQDDNLRNAYVYYQSY